MFYPKSATGLVDKGLLAKYDKTYADKLLEADNVYIRSNGNITRRPPLVRRGISLNKGDILDAVSTKTHYVILRKVDTSSLTTSNTLFQHASAFQQQLQKTIQKTGTRTTPINAVHSDLIGVLNSSVSYTITPDSDIVAIDFYDKSTGEFNKSYSRAFAIHKHQTSFIGNTKMRESNRLVATASSRIDTDLKGADADPVLLGIYGNYTEPGDDVESLKYIPPTVLSVPSHVIGASSSTLQDIIKKLGWVCYEEDFIYQALSQHYLEAGSDFRRLEFDEYEFIGGEYLNGNVEKLSVYDDNVIFTFCGLGYRIEQGGDLICIHSPDPLPSIKTVNQDTIKTYPLQRDITRDRTIPIRIYLRQKASGSLGTEEVLTEENFRTLYPEYASILESLSQVVTYTPLKINNGYSNDTYYAMPDVKFLIPQTDIPASCKYISKGESIDQGAWFGVPTMRDAYMDKTGWLNVTNDIKFPVDHGVSAEGVGASAVLIKRDKAREILSRPQPQRDPNRPADETDDEGNPTNPLVDAPFSEWTVPNYVNRALKLVFEGVDVDIPTAYLEASGEIQTQEDEEENGEGTEMQPQEGSGNYGTIPSIAFSNETVQPDQFLQRDRKFNITTEETTENNQIEALIHVELDYQSDEFKEFFNDKQLLSLPSSDGHKGYSFEAFKKGGLDADVGFGSVEGHRRHKNM